MASVARALARHVATITAPKSMPVVARTAGWARSGSLMRPSGRSPRAEDPVARVAEAGEDVAVRVELAVERGAVDGYVGVGREHLRHPLRRGDDGEEPD